MKNPIDFEKIQHIIEKIEQGEVLDDSEKVYLDIIQALQTKKKEPVEIDADFLSNLKEELLIKYDELYGKKEFYQRFSSIVQTPFWGVALSFCFVFFVAFGVYNGLNFGHKGGIEFGSKNISNTVTEGSQSNSLPQASKEEEYTEVHSSLDGISESKEYSRRGGGLEFGGGDMTLHSIAGSSNEGGSYFSGIIRIVGEYFIIIGILMISILTALIIVLKKKKK